MQVRIHWSIGEYDDSIVVEGDTIEEIREEAEKVVIRRGLDVDKNNLWSEEI